MIPARTASPIGGRADGVAAMRSIRSIHSMKISLEQAARVWEAGNRIFIDTSDSYLFTLGLRAEEIAGSSWNLDVGGRYSRLEADTESYLLNITRSTNCSIKHLQSSSLEVSLRAKMH